LTSTFSPMLTILKDYIICRSVTCAFKGPELQVNG
jgi:hypothetical protein